MPDAILETKIHPPKLIPSLMEGFNAVASHIHIIFLPVAFDLLLWFGPLLRVKDLLLPAILDATEISAAAYGQDSQLFIDSSKELWMAMLEQFNLFFGLRTYPVGIPSLLLSKGVLENPMGAQHVIEMQSSSLTLWLLIAFTLAGLALGSLYFALIASVVSEDGAPVRLATFVGQMLQAMLLSVILFAALFLISMPAMCLISSLLFFIPALGTIPLLLFGLILVWVLMPVVFSPHGIFADQLKAAAAIANSFRLVRSLMSLTGMFFIMLIMLSYGLDFLWSTPKADNWMLLVGIIGHAFISSGLIAASFIYYQKGIRWLRAAAPLAAAVKPENIA